MEKPKYLIWTIFKRQYKNAAPTTSTVTLPTKIFT